MKDVFVSIISARRPERVPAMNQHAPNATWFVAFGEGEQYRAAGAINVIESGGLCESRNAALEYAFSQNLPCVQLSDDLKAIKKAHSKKQTEPMSFAKAASEMLHAAKTYKSHLVGVAPTSNAFYYNPEKPHKINAFIVGDMILVMPCDIRFDTNMRLKEDYDYTLSHIRQFGKVVRVDNILAEFAHRTNKGGAVAYRTSALEQSCISYLKKKWGNRIKDNPRRANEILLNLK